mgnify:CR=1 FL=1
MKDADLVLTGEGRVDAQCAYGTLTQAAWRAIAEENDPPHLFVNGGIPARIEYNRSTEKIVIRELTVDRQ